MSLTAVDCQGFAGGFTLGTVQAGFELIGKREMKGGFGVPNCEANRHLLGHKWKTQAVDHQEWEPLSTNLVFGNPPCSGFSPLSPKDFRGSASPINACMHAFAGYAARCMPEIAVFESVQQAYSGGIDLMRYLRDSVEQVTGVGWNLHHVKHNAASVGGCAIRRRYFWLIARIPFGIEPPRIPGVPTLTDAIGDLDGLESTWELQPYRRESSWWAEPLRSDLGAVDGHSIDWTPYTRRALDLINGGQPWGIRENISTVARRYHAEHGCLPDSWAGSAQRVIESDFNLGYNQLVRWKPDGMARVITGGALSLVLHPWLDRPITHREAARIQGFPDDWLIRPLRGVSGLRSTWGKGIPVQCGRWIAEWCRRAIEGNPGTHPGEKIGEKEYLIDCTNTYRTHSSES